MHSSTGADGPLCRDHYINTQIKKTNLEISNWTWSGLTPCWSLLNESLEEEEGSGGEESERRGSCESAVGEAMTKS